MGVKLGSPFEKARKQLGANKDGVSRKCKIYNYECGVLLEQRDGKFAVGLIVFMKEYFSSLEYWQRCEKISGGLRERFGAPDNDGEHAIWTDDLFKNDSQHYPLALTSGRLKIVEKWNVGNVEVLHVCTRKSGDNPGLLHSVRYLDISLKQAETKSDNPF